MRADMKLLELNLFESRAQAQAAIELGCVFVDGQRVRKPSQKIPNSAKITAERAHPWVSRAGVKLAHALDMFNIDVVGKTALDVGASTGGFTEVLLAKGIAHVIAVDVGTDQLHKRLKNHKNVTSLEQTDARHLTADMFDSAPDIIVCDVSFISSMKALAVPLSFAGPNAVLISLVKPQFEVGPDGIGRGGLVKTEALSKSALANMKEWLERQNWTVTHSDKSPIQGGSGNTEFLICAYKA